MPDSPARGEGIAKHGYPTISLMRSTGDTPSVRGEPRSSCDFSKELAYFFPAMFVPEVRLCLVGASS